MKYEVITWPIDTAVGLRYTFTAVSDGELMSLPPKIYRMYKHEETAMRNGIKFIQKHSNKKIKPNRQ